MTDLTKKIAIVVGATGVVGRELVQQLSMADHIGEVRTLTRRSVTTDLNKVVNHVVDFESLEESSHLFAGDLFFSCLGTTRKAAGGVRQQRRVDLGYQLTCAELAFEQGCSHCLLVSSSGANRHSLMAYPKMKGELEYAVQQLGFTRLTILQPSLLLGEREDRRIGEELGSLVLPALTKLPGLRRARPIRGDEVAKRLVLESTREDPGIKTLTLDEIFMP